MEFMNIEVLHYSSLLLRFLYDVNKKIRPYIEFKKEREKKRGSITEKAVSVRKTFYEDMIM